MVGGVVAAFIVAVEEGSGDETMLGRDEHADAEAPIVLAIVLVLEVVGKKARVQPHLDRFVGQRGGGAGEEEACKGPAKHEFPVLHVNSEACQSRQYCI